MSKNTSAPSVSSPAKPKRSASDETKIKKLYDEQQLNIKMGNELYGISEKINPIEPIPGVMQNFELDYEINELQDGKLCILGDTIFKCRVPPASALDEIRKLDICKKGLMKPEIFRSMLRTIDSFRRPSDCFNIYCEKMSEEQVRDLHKRLQILTDLEKNLFVFETTSANGKRVLRVMGRKGGKMTNEDLLKWGWEQEFVHFTLKKRNIPFKKPLLAIAEVLDIEKEAIGFAQLKEAGPVSIQRISVPKIAVDKLQKLTKQDKFMVGNFEVKTNCVKIGELDGNRYRLVLRGLNAKNKDQVNDHEECLKFLERNGFINYYGNKRFLSKKGVPAYQIGKALLTRNFEEAINLIMTPSKDDNSDVRAMKERWVLSDGSPIKTLEGPDAIKNEYEYKLVQQLEQNPDDLVAALEKIPLNVRLGYIFAYQSYIWNIIASQRVKRKGLKLFVGDIVLAQCDKTVPPEFFEDFSIPLTSRWETLPELKRDPKQKPNYKEAIKFVTQEDLDAQKYTIHDLVLPLPGSEVLFPRNNDVGIWYTDFLSKDGLNKTRLSDKYCINGNEIIQNTNYFLHGTYRKLIVVPKDLKWEFKTYKKLSDNLLDKESRAKVEGNSDKLALVVEFTLPADSYVQMALREIVDLEKSGFNDIFQANKKAAEEERKETEKADKEKQAREKRDKERADRERAEREKKAKMNEKREKPVVSKEPVRIPERLSGGGPRKERLDGKVSKDKRDTSRELSHASSSREVLDGRKRSRSPINRSREVSRNSNSRIEVRVDNNNIRSRSNERFPFPDQASFDGIPICEFVTLPQEPDIDDSFNNASRNLSMRDDFNTSRVWEPPPRGGSPDPPFDDRFDREMDRGARQSVFDGRLEPRQILRNPDAPDVEPGRLLQPPSFFQRGDDLRNRLNESNFDIDREFDRFEQEVQELNRDCIRDQEIRFREALEQEERMRYGRLDDLRRPADEPLSPQIAEKLRRLDEEALRLDLKRVTRLQNFDISQRRNEDDFRNMPDRGRDFGDDRNMGMTREQVMNRSREMEEFDRNFLRERSNERPPRDQMMNEARFEQGQQQQRRFIEEIPLRSPSPPPHNRSFDRQQGPNDDRFGQRNVDGPLDDRFGARNMDQQRPDDFRGGNNNNFGPRDSSFADLRNNFGPQFAEQRNNPSRNSQMGQFDRNPEGPSFMNNQQYNNRNFGQSPPQGPNQFNNNDRPQQMMSQQQQQQQRGMDVPWNNLNNMMNNRQNSPPKQFPQQQWMNQENPNFGPNNGPMGGNQFGNQMFGNNNNNNGGGPFQGGPGGGMQGFPNNNPQMMNNNMNMNNMFQNPMMNGPGPGMMGGFQNNMRGNNMQGGPPGGGMMMQDRPNIAPPGFRQQNINSRRKSRFN